MAAGRILAIYLGVFALHFAVEQLLLALALCHARACRERPPAEALALLPPEEYTAACATLRPAAGWL